MKLELYPQIFGSHSNIKFQKSRSNGSRVVPCGQTDMTQLTVAFRNFANVPNMEPQYKKYTVAYGLYGCERGISY